LLIEKISWRHIDVLISVSPSILEWYQKNLGLKESLLILNSPQFKINKCPSVSNNYLRDKFNIPKNCKVYIYVGIIDKGRSIDMYLDIFQSSEINSHIVFLGFGGYVSKVQLASINCEKIHYHPRVDHFEIVNISKSADVGLLFIEPTSLSDIFCLPNKLFEYAFADLFIVASDFPDMKKVIEDYELGMVSSLDINSIKKTIIELEHSNIARVSTKDLHELSWDFQSYKLINLYKVILDH
jgi:glycosyltransferase involved in cell wall biosynthesis